MSTSETTYVSISNETPNTVTIDDERKVVVWGTPSLPITNVTIAVAGTETIDQVLVDDRHACFWIITAWKAAATRSTIIYATHDGHSGADAANVTNVESNTLVIGSLGVSFAVDLNGSGTSQVMRLRATTTETDVIVRAVRIPA